MVRRKLNVRTVRTSTITSLAIRGYFHPFIKRFVRSLVMVVEITWLLVRSGIKCFLTGLEVSLRLAIASALERGPYNRPQREAGWSNRRIGRHLGRSDMVVARCWQQWITEGRVYRRGGSGRPRNTNDREDRAIRRVATSAPTTSLASIQRHLPPSRHPVPSRETIRRRLTERRTGQRSDPAFIVERHTAISQGVTVWGAISWDTRSSLVVLQGTLTARRYVDDILTPIVLPMLSSRPGAIYQQDNARPHTARLSQQCLQGYDVLTWPARSPDLSPIEHVWDVAAVPR
ncbi:HTH_Tnp_Tc3_2 domain-containing protein [Trichonephila clavipes]|nr:HTH_Tnp_Tc3_2 domain-containing protein [Trichonephila clavipes]